MLIRPVRYEDAASLQRHCFGAMTIEQVAAMIESLVDVTDTVSLVADDGSEAVASCTVTRLTHRLCRHRADIGGFVIAPSAQGTGLARRIVNEASRYAREWDCTILEISCRGGTHAEEAYVGLGFTEWARLPGGYREEAGTFDEVRLWKRLDG
ncbi:GNAT family N-acetyltransferase [Tenggerimyces flavus]|uniref:GNAT family N-acetyltransferase n=1 Tax=Tenggerimyces flavus TaxID=1708749 RepID=A0ABV7YC71_9ACTN|nr:GNAT family N-acetyltransferase [Tenggerimyces flavus]MBM7783586.1 GNAT superfamily N-acetyltransferase [Tenggerimyces flavus]